MNCRCSMSSSYALIVFVDENLVSVVPAMWLDGNDCFWPPYKTQERLDKAVKTAELPHKSWTKYQVKILGIKGN